jgi:hypothetical protein
LAPRRYVVRVSPNGTLGTRLEHTCVPMHNET